MWHPIMGRSFDYGQEGDLLMRTNGAVVPFGPEWVYVTKDWLWANIMVKIEGEPE